MRPAASYVFLLAVLCLGLLAASSVSAGNRVSLGIKGGLAFGDQNWEYSQTPDLVDPDHLNAIALGVFVDIPMSPSVSFRPEALYVRKGSRADIVVTDELGEILGTIYKEDHIDYLSMLVSARVKTPLTLLGDWYVTGGARMDFKLSTYSDDDSPSQNLINASYKDGVPGVTFGLGVENLFGVRPGLSLEARYDLDLGNAMELNNTLNDLEIKNKSLMILAGITF